MIIWIIWKEEETVASSYLFLLTCSDGDFTSFQGNGMMKNRKLITRCFGQTHWHSILTMCFFTQWLSFNKNICIIHLLNIYHNYATAFHTSYILLDQLKWGRSCCTSFFISPNLFWPKLHWLSRQRDDEKQYHNYMTFR